MLSFNPYIHNIDPVMGTICGVHLWWYGLSYSLGFLNIYLYLQRRSKQICMSKTACLNLCFFIIIGVLIGGRFIEVVFYEWPFYREHMQLIPAYWLGGMATHGLLLGAITGMGLFCLIYRQSFLGIADALTVPAAFILAAGRIGNFIDGQIVGSLTDAWCAVKFPDAEGFRHPVVLYDGIKNFLLIPILFFVSRRRLPAGVISGIFLFLYAFLRIFIDLFREYPTSLLGLATGQSLNICMSLAGLLIICLCSGKHIPADKPVAAGSVNAGANLASSGVFLRKFLFGIILVFSLTIPSDWTQDIPSRYGKRHAGLTYSVVYPRIQTSAEQNDQRLKQESAS